jgi:pimeloyl-ACP methyl ester carboxylesterase
MFIKTHGNASGLDNVVNWLGVPGWAESHRCFEPLAQQLPDAHLLHALDLPGTGLSPLDARGLTLEVVVDQIAVALESLPDGPVGVIGNCGGALFALSAAMASRRNVSSAVLIDAFAFLPGYFKLLLLRGPGRLAYNLSFANPIGRAITNTALRSKRQATTDLMASFAQGNPQIHYRYLQLFEQIGEVSQYRTFNGEVTLIHGSRTFAAVRKSVPLWRANWPELKVYEIYPAGHAPLTEAAEAVAQIVFHPQSAGKVS